MKHLYYCRHGQSQLNKDGLWSGSLETPLTDEGRADARAAGLSAKALRIDYIIASPLSRALDTAKIIAEKIGYDESHIEVNDLLIERHFGELEGKPWGLHIEMDSTPGAESSESVLQRARLAYEHLKTLNVDTILVVSHGTFGRALRHVINPAIPFQSTDKFANAQIVKLL